MMYFDNAATGFPKSQKVFAAMSDAFFTCGNAGRSAHPAAAAASETLFKCRELLGGMFGVRPENVVLTCNATLALNMAIKGIFKSGTVLTSPLEHNSVARPLFSIKDAGKIKVKTIDLFLHDDDKTVLRFEKKLPKNFSGLVITHASNVCGKVLPVAELADITHKNGGVVIADCSQTAGHFPFTVDSLNADVICISGHKGLYGPLGTGAMIISDSFNKVIDTIIEGGSGAVSVSKRMPETLPERLEAGTPNAVSFAGLAAAVEETEYSDNAEKIFSFLLSELEDYSNLKIFGAPYAKDEAYTPVISFVPKNKTPTSAAELLSAAGFCVRDGLHCAPGAHRFLGSRDGSVRISPGRATTVCEAEKLLCAIKRL